MQANFKVKLRKALLAAAALVAASCPATSQELKKVRVGWQPTSMISAQVIHTMTRTDIMEKNGLQGDFSMFTLGPAVNEALVSNAIDIGIVGDLPSLSLAAVGAPVKVVGRVTSIRAAILASTKSDIKSIADLKGKKVFGPFGTAAFLAVRAILEKNELRVGKDVQMVNIAFNDIGDAIQAGSVDAFFVFEPWVTFFEKRGFGRIIGEDRNLMLVVVAREDFLKKNPDAVERFLKAHKEATLFSAQNHSLTNRWFVTPANARVLGEDVVEASALLDPQWSATSMSDIRLAISPTEKERYLRLGKEAAELKIFPKMPSVEDNIENSLAQRIDATVSGFNPATVKIFKQ